MEQLLQPVTYGSVIYVSTESNLNEFMFSDGFVNNSVELRENLTEFYDFSFCLFMVLPFSNEQSFIKQTEILRDWRTLYQKNEQTLSQRKDAIQKMFNQMESEYQSNLGVLQKNQSQSICFGSSNFMLLHINSLKFLSLYRDDNNNLFLQLSEHPNENCFFYFDPSLKIQKGRSDNFVYEDEIVHIACTQKFSGKSPYLSRFDQSQLIIGLIDTKENWKVNIYEEPIQDQYMKIGSYVWILSSEKQLFLSVQREQDPFLEQYEYEQNPQNRNRILIERQLSLKEHKQQQHSNSHIQNYLDEQRKYYLRGMKVLLQSLKQESDKVGESEELSPYGLWKIEAQYERKGGQMRWDQQYRFKHVITGLYLGIENDRMVITENKYNFSFVAIDNLLSYKSKSKSTTKISKDAYFMLYDNNNWIGFSEEDKSEKIQLLKYKKDVNTFRFIEASQQSVWDNYSITASQKLFMTMLKCSMNTIQLSQQANLTKEQSDYKQIYDTNFDNTKQQFDFFKQFILNKHVSSIDLEQEIIQPCRIRQVRLRDQFQLGLICWFIINTFPTFEEFEIMQISPEEASIENMNKGTCIRRRKDGKLPKIMSNNYKLAQEHLIKRYTLCKQAYELIALMSINNPENQKFVLKFIVRMSEHIGFGSFVTQSLKICFQNNKEILEELHRYVIPIDDKDINKSQQHIFQAMAHRLKCFEPYQKIEILDLMASFTNYKQQAIYINQEKVFQSIIDNKNFLFGHLMKIFCDQQLIQVEYRIFVEKEYESQTMNFNNFIKAANIKTEYFKMQLRLFSSLCQNRNYACVKNMQELLPQKILINCLYHDQLDVSVKAIICSLLLNLYIDQEPKSIIAKPSFVRVFNQDEDISKKFIQLNLRDDIKGTLEIRNLLIEHLRQCYDKLSTNCKVEDVYDEYTYQIVRSVSFMIRFGIFTKYSTRLMKQSLQEHVVEYELENLVKYLSLLLEYDYNYFYELKENGFKFKYTEEQEERLVFSFGLNLGQQKQVENQEEEEIIANQEESQESYTFLKRYQALFRLIKKFSNKTCQNQEYITSADNDYQVLIKKQICIIFSDLMQWREDIYIERVLQFFQQNQQNFQSNKPIDYNNLMPELGTIPGQKKFSDKIEMEEISDFDSIIQRPFVEILMLAFYFAKDSELQNQIANLLYKRHSQRKKLLLNLKKVSLVTGTNTSYQKLSTLVNQITNLISYSQSWLQIIEQDTYEEQAENTLRETERKYLELLDVFKSTNDEEAFYINQKIFKHLGGHKLLTKFMESGYRVIETRIDYFEIKESQNQEFSYKKQFINSVINVFTRCHQILGQFVIRNSENQQSVYKNYYNILDKDIKINLGQVEFLEALYNGNYNLCIKPQGIIFRQVIKNIQLHGQDYRFIKLFQIFLDSNNKTSVEIQKSILNMILENFQTLDPVQLKHALPENGNLVTRKNKPVIVKNNLPQFFKDGQDQRLYVNSFIGIISQCIANDVGINYVVRCSQELEISYLIEELGNDNLLIRYQIYQIIQVYFDKIDRATDEFQKSCNQFIILLNKTQERMNSQISQEDQLFIGCFLLGLINIYFEKFLEDIGMISLKMLSGDEAISKEQKIFVFAQKFYDSWKYFDKNIPLEMYQNIVRLCQNFSMDIRDFNLQEEERESIKYTITKPKADKQVVQQKKSDYLNLWDNFISQLKKQPVIKQQLLEESNKFPQVILQISDMFSFNNEVDLRLKELIISKDDVIIQLLEYIKYWKIKNSNRSTILFILKSLRQLLGAQEQQDQKIKRQNHLNSLGATNIIFRLYWKDKQTEGTYIYELIKFIIELLQGGNKNIQLSILKLLQSDPESESFFRKVYKVLNEFMIQMKKQDDKNQGSKKAKIIEKTLEVIQLLCEGHNVYLQNYLRQQTNSKVSYDIVSLMVKLVITNKISDETYESIVQCLDTLTEVVQGPCKDNQVIIVTSKFIQWSMDLLKEDPKLFNIKDNLLLIDKVKLSRLKYKCSITLLSLIEMQEQNDEIMNILIRSISCSILLNELIKVYEGYENIYKDQYITKAFKQYIDQDDLQNPDILGAKTIIIEYGFNLFILINILMLKSQKAQEPELEEIFNMIKNYQFVKEQKKSIDDFLDIDVTNLINLKDITNFIKDAEESDIFKKKQEQQKKTFNFFAGNTVFIEIQRDKELQRIYFPLLPQCKMLPSEQKAEFHDNVDHSSIREKLNTLMKQADYMSKVMDHEEFLRNIFKQIKIIEMIATHKTLWENLSFLTNIMLNFVILVSYSSYVYTDKLPQYQPPDFNQIIFQNYAIASASVVQSLSTVSISDLVQNRLYEPRLFYNNSYDWTGLLIMILGYINLGFSLLVIFFFAIKKAPLLLNDMWKKFLEEKETYYTVRFCKYLYMIAKSFVVCLVDLDFAYYMGYIACIVLGIIIHPFIFVFLLSDFLRIETLSIVIKAIWITKGPMGLTFMVFILTEYYFTIISYLYFSDQYQPLESCSSIWRCFLMTFDQTFKNGGALGDWLVDPLLQSGGSQLPYNYDLDIDQQYDYLYRFFYDVLFKFILVFLIINMVAGIIIDTFGSLKDKMLEKKSFLTEYCFICGIETEKLDKSSEYGCYSHIKKNHYMWNYVYYKVYLQWKSATELSGNETYVMKMIQNNEIDWFPIKQAMGFVDEDEDEDQEQESNLEQVEEVFQDIQQLDQVAVQSSAKIKQFAEKQP